MTRGRSLIYLPRRRPVCVKSEQLDANYWLRWFPWHTSGGTDGGLVHWVVQHWSYQWVDELAYRPDRAE